MVELRLGKAERAAAASKAFLAKYAKKEEIPCPHLQPGRCRHGYKCTFQHVPTEAPRDGSYVKAWEDIPCQLPRANTDRCTAAPYCVYYPCAEMQRLDREREADPNAGSSVMPPPTCHNHG